MTLHMKIITRSITLGAIAMACFTLPMETEPVEVFNGHAPKSHAAMVVDLLDSQVKEHAGCVSVFDWKSGQIPTSMLVHTGKAPNANVVYSVPFTLDPVEVNVLAWCK